MPSGRAEFVFFVVVVVVFEQQVGEDAKLGGVEESFSLKETTGEKRGSQLSNIPYHRT